MEMKWQNNKDMMWTKVKFYYLDVFVNTEEANRSDLDTE
jgi:hypothetical protein